MFNLNIEDLTLLQKINDQLRELNNRAKVQYNDEFEVEFYKKVKPFADEIKELSDQWKELVIQWIKEEKPLYIHPINIYNTHENLNIISVQAFYADAKKKRFHELIESNAFILDNVQRLLNENKKLSKK